LVQPHGAKLWRLKHRHGGRERVYAVGVYDEIGLAAARVERDRARQWVREGRDPTIERRVAKVLEGQQQALTFSVLAEEWFAQKSRAWSPAHRTSQRNRMDGDLLPLGARDCGS
jgi:hypothetical protein